MAIQIQPYELERLTDVTALYNEAIQDVPLAFPATSDEMASGLAGVLREGEGVSGMRHEAAFVAGEGGEALGFIHVGLGCPWRETTDEYGVIRFLAYRRGRRDVGQSLLEAGAAHLRAFPIPRIATFDHHHRYPFYQVDSAYLSERIAHVHALLGLNGYRPWKGEVILGWREFAPPDPGLPPIECEVTLTRKDQTPGSPRFSVKAVRDGQVLGECLIGSVGETTSALPAKEWALVDWLGVEEPWRGKGLGRFLLSHGLREARAAGYPHAVISTDWRNDRAFVFYSNFGFRLLDWTYSFSRDL